MDSIKATYRSCRGIGECALCPESRKKELDVLYGYNGAEDVGEADRLFYEEMLCHGLEAQNERYRKKGNYGRIWWTMDEWRKSVRHRPIENVLLVGNAEHHLHLRALVEAYIKFCDRREERFGEIFFLISVFTDIRSKIAHIHERYVLLWTDEEGVRHIGIDRALEQAGVDVLFPGSEEGRYNNRKMKFDQLCREMWRDTVAEALEDDPDTELDRDARLSLGDLIWISEMRGGGLMERLQS